MILRLRHQQRGGHTSVRVFAAMHHNPEQTLGRAGELTFTNEEWEVLRRRLRSDAPSELRVIFKEDDR